MSDPAEPDGNGHAGTSPGGGTDTSLEAGPRDGAYSRLRRLAQSVARDAEERCDLCGDPIPLDHRHLLALSTREILCACRACVILFSNAGAGAGNRRLIPTRYQSLPGFDISDAMWESLRLPVNLAFFIRDSAAGHVRTYYPGPMGPTESLLTLESWDDLEQRNPVLRSIEPDIEALLVNRVRDTRAYYIVPIDECYRLVGIIRVYWRGFTGGREVWAEIDRFFAELDQRGTPHPRPSGYPTRSASGGARA